jgi:hypothetical protein
MKKVFLRSGSRPVHALQHIIHPKNRFLHEKSSFPTVRKGRPLKSIALQTFINPQKHDKKNDP